MHDGQEELNPNQAREVVDIHTLADIIRRAFPGTTWDDSPEETARRVLGYWKEFRPQCEPDFNMTTFPLVSQSLVAVVDMEYTSMCSHHLLPFYGSAYIAYIPDQLQIGLSKIPRVLEYFATRPQMQERIAMQVADFLENALKPQGVMVILKAKHTCMSCRGARNMNGKMIASEARGVFLDNTRHARQEFLALVGFNGVV